MALLFTKNWGLFAHMQFVVLLVFLCVFGYFCLLFVFVRLFCKKAPKGYFPAIFEVICYFVPPQGLSLKSFFETNFLKSPS